MYRLSAVVSALGVSMMLENGIVLIWSPRMRVFPQGILPSASWNIGGVVITFTQLLIIVVSLLLMLALYLYVNRTRFGTAIRAAAIDQDAARLMGINVNRVIVSVFVLGPALGAFGGLFIGLYGVSLRVAEGEVVAILGSNGAGKTTLMRSLSGLRRAGSGSIAYRGEELVGQRADLIVRKGIAQSPEGRRVLGTLTVAENLGLGAYTRSPSEIDGSRAEVYQTGVTVLVVEQNARMALKLADRGYVPEVGRIVHEDSAANLLASPAVQEAYLCKTDAH